MNLSSHQKCELIRIATATLLLIGVWISPLTETARLIAFLIPYGIVGLDILITSIRHIGHGQIFDETFLMSIATIGAFILGEYPEAVCVMIFFKVGTLFEDFAITRSRKSIAELMNLSPETATVLRNGTEEIVHPSTISIGETIVIKPGEKVPLDGLVREGESTLDTAALTGESIPRHIGKNDEIISGCINLTGVLTVETTKSSETSTVSRILELVESASVRKAKTEQFITRFSRYYTPIIVSIAVFIALIPPLLFHQDWNDWIFRALMLLVISCPCALVISVPLSFFAGIGTASRHGILVKGGNYLESLTKADTFIFDKTGTITTGTFTVAKHDKNALKIAAYAGYKSSHPLSISIVQAWNNPIPYTRIQNIQEYSGKGISAQLDGKEILAGNIPFLQEHNIILPSSLPNTETVVVTAHNGVYSGCVYLHDTVKPDAQKTITALKRDYHVKKTVLLTGDRKPVADAVSRQIGIDEVHAELLPQQKVAILETLLHSQTGKTVYTGDGINDAPVLARADIGIAMGAFGSDAAIEAADIVLMDDSLEKIPFLCKIARKTKNIVNENIVFILTVKFSFLILSGIGLTTMWSAIFADVGVAIIAILNAMRMMHI